MTRKKITRRTTRKSTRKTGRTVTRKSKKVRTGRQRTYEKLYTCTSCGTQNKTRVGNCFSCGNPIDGNELRDATVITTPVTDQAVLDTITGRAQFCVYCGSANHQNNDNCRNCGANEFVLYKPDPNRLKGIEWELRQRTHEPPKNGAAASPEELEAMREAKRLADKAQHEREAAERSRREAQRKAAEEERKKNELWGFDCAFCEESGNKDHRTNCRQCGADYATSKAEYDRIQEELRRKAAEEAERDRLEAEAAAEKARRRAALNKTFRNIGIGLLVVAGIAAFAIFFWWAAQTTDHPGQISNMEWERTTFRETFREVDKANWRRNINVGPPRMPVDGSGERPGAILGLCVDKHYRWVPETCPGSTHVVRHGSSAGRVPYTCGDAHNCQRINGRKVHIREDPNDCWEEKVPGSCRDVNCREENCREYETNCRLTNCRDVGCVDDGFSVTCDEECDEVCDMVEECDEVCDEECDYREVCNDIWDMQYQVQCETSEERTWCDYSTWEWQPSGANTLTGTGHDMDWPTIELGPLDRKRHVGSYVVSYTWTDSNGRQLSESFEPNLGSKSSPTTNEVGDGAYLSFEVGDPIVVEENNLGVIVGQWRGDAIHNPELR